MREIFETSNPKNSTVAKYVDYYYLDIKPENEITEFECFPHYNNTISFYRSHTRSPEGEITYGENGEPFHIFTPMREKVLYVKQVGKVHRIVVVFNILGIQQFYKSLNFSNFITDFEFLTKPELDDLFESNEIDTIADLLDRYLLDRYVEFNNDVLHQSIQDIFDNYENFSVESLAKKMGISRRHLNRLFKIHIGVSIKKFHEIVLFRKAVEKKLFINPDEKFTTLAYEFNFSDQAHLNKTFANLTNKSPKLFFKKGTLLGKEDTFWHLLK
jgi:AraC-like DNA-binding protein